MITFMARIHMIMNMMHYKAVAMIKHYPCDLTVNIMLWDLIV